MKHIALTIFFIVFGIQINVCFPQNPRNSSKNYKIDYTLWQILLDDHVSDGGLVDYKHFFEDKDKLKRFTEYLMQHTPQNSWSDNQKKAYLINAYNAFTIQLILENYPVESIKDISGLFSNVFKEDFIDFNAEKISLDDIEKGMLLPMGDPRVHFAVNCASYSCPKLHNKPYKPENLDFQLDQAAKSFVNSERNEINENHLKLSKIFKWYKNDFESESGSIIDFINTYSKTKINSKASIEYLDYSWKLNSQN